MKKKLFVLSLALVLIIGAGYIYIASASKEVLRIGREVISRKELALKLAADNCYMDEKNYDEVPSLMSLINYNFEKEVLRSYYKASISRIDLEEKSEWVDQNTKAPDILACVKKAYGSETNFYIKNFIALAPVNQKLHDLFQNDPVIHKVEFEKISEIKSRINKENFSKQEGYREVIVDSSANPGESKELDPKAPLIHSFLLEDQALEDKIKQMKPGEIWSDIIQEKYGYLIVRMLRRAGDKFTYGLVSVQKKSFDDWFRNYIKDNISVEFFDSEIEEKIREVYPDLWWLTR